MLAIVAVAALLNAAPPTHVAAADARARATVVPSTGVPSSVFTLSFRAVASTGRSGSIERRDVVFGSLTGRAVGCATSFAASARDAAAGVRVRVTLRPPKPTSRWCVGVYRGTVDEREQPVCAPGRACPAFIVVRAIARFSFRVAAAHPRPVSGAAAPAFAGLRSAFACTPGAQRPGETTPFTLSWEPAVDPATPSSEIVYDVYLASAPGGEDYRMPTWTTPRGVTIFRTPGLPSHGTFYFVVRARDAAGREDANTTERRGVDPCY
ncbi:MAG TPA: hypothetical protein VH115_02390 [Solirubrobacteraceae bacterium]|nr:hypothetical protein [Solirubrobacteraceae bacterium]